MRSLQKRLIAGKFLFWIMHVAESHFLLKLLPFQQQQVSLLLTGPHSEWTSTLVPHYRQSLVRSSGRLLSLSRERFILTKLIKKLY